VAAHTLTTLFCLVVKDQSTEGARVALKELLQFLSVAPVDQAAIEQALNRVAIGSTGGMSTTDCSSTRRFASSLPLHQLAKYPRTGNPERKSDVNRSKPLRCQETDRNP